MLVVLEGIVMCFVLLLVCVVGIANGPVGLVTFYEPEVQERVIELGLTTRERIKRNTALAGIGLFVPALFLVPYMVYGVNGAQSFREGFTQMLIISLIYGLFDSLSIGGGSATRAPGSSPAPRTSCRTSTERRWQSNGLVPLSRSHSCTLSSPGS